jgi:hypothetical protein
LSTVNTRGHYFLESSTIVDWKLQEVSQEIRERK